MPEYITDNIKIPFEDSDKEDSDEEKFPMKKILMK